MMKSNFEIKINKEIRDYTESIFFGLSLRLIRTAGTEDACL